MSKTGMRFIPGIYNYCDYWCEGKNKGKTREKQGTDPRISLSWNGWVIANGGDITYKFFAIPGSGTFSCYTWAGEAAVKAMILNLLRI